MFNAQSSHLEMSLFLTSANWQPGAISLSLASTRLSQSHPQLYGTNSHLAESVYTTDPWDLLPAQCGAWFVVAPPSENLSANWLRTGEVPHFIASSHFHELFSVCLHLAHLPFSIRSLQGLLSAGIQSYKGAGTALDVLCCVCSCTEEERAAALVGVIFWWWPRK